MLLQVYVSTNIHTLFSGSPLKTGGPDLLCTGDCTGPMFLPKAMTLLLCQRCMGGSARRWPCSLTASLLAVGGLSSRPNVQVTCAEPRVLQGCCRTCQLFKRQKETVTSSAAREIPAKWSLPSSQALLSPMSEACFVWLQPTWRLDEAAFPQESAWNVSSPC